MSPAGAESPAPDGLPPGRRGAAAACIAAGITVTVLDAAMLNIALPTAALDLGLTPAEVIWIVNAYQIVVVGTLIPMSSLGEVLGYRRVWAAGLALFCAASVFNAFAPGFEALLAGRMVQAVGSAAVMALTAGLVRHTYPANQLGRAIGVNAMTVGLASAAGPTLGALVLAVADWHAVFLAHVPLGLAALLFGIRLAPRAGPQRRGFDLPAAGMNVAGFGLVFAGLDRMLHQPWLGVLLLVGGAASLAALVRHEMGRAVPLLPLDLLRIRVVRFAVSASVCMFSAHMVLVIAMPFHLSAAGFSPIEIGLIVTPYPLAVGLLGPLAGRWADRANSPLSCVLGGLFLAASLLMLAVVPADSVPLVGLAMLLAGIGFAGFQSPNNRTMLSAAPRARAGSAGGMQATARVLGQSLGAIVTAASFTLAGPPAAFLVGGAASLVAAGLSMARGRG